MGKLSRKRQREITDTLSSRTVRMRGSERVQIRKQATAVLKTHAGHDKLVFLGQMRRIPLSAERHQEAKRDFERNPEPFSRAMCMRMARYSNLVHAIRRVLNDDNPYPFAIIRNLYPTCSLPWSTTQRAAHREEWYLRDLVYDFVSSGLIHLTDKAVHRRKSEGDLPRKEFMTSSREEVNILNEGRDLPLRYRQATPDLKCEGETEYLRQQDMAARIVVFACIENPIADPVYLLPTSEIFKAMAPEDINALATPNFSVFDRLEENLTQRHPFPNQCIALPKDTPESSWMSFDLNRMDLQTPAIDDQREALKRLVETIELLDKGKKSHEAKDNWKETRAIPIDLQRGDALIVDNYRMLFRRREQAFTEFDRLLWGRPAVRWLRAYYGFPDTESGNGSVQHDSD